MRITNQKELIQKEIQKLESFFTAEGLFHEVCLQNKKIGLATIYRFLKDLRKKGELHSYLCNRRMVYSLDRNNHCHFTCQKCGEIKHFEVESLDFLDLEEKICHFQIDISGTCKKCLRKEK